MKAYLGTSGFSYAEWKGTFYPADLKQADMLAYYAERLRSVEINNTFYRMPRKDLLAAWAAAVPDEFRFVIKAPRRITHQLKLAGAGDALGYLFDALSELGQRRGPLLFQLPPFFKKDVARLRDFLAELPPGTQAAFEFRNPTWFDDEVYATLAAADVALCGGDVEEERKNPPLVKTAGVGYLRLRRSEYDEAALQAWAERIRGQGFAEVYAFFKHEELGPMLAQRLQQLLD